MGLAPVSFFHDTPDRKALLSSTLDRIDVYEGRIRIRGRKDVLEQCVNAGVAAPRVFA